MVRATSTTGTLKEFQTMFDHAKQQRDAAREIFLRALQATTVAAAVERSVQCDGNTLRAAGRAYDMGRYSEICIVSIGKAGATMFDAIDALLPPTLKRSVVISAPAPPQRMSADVQYFRGGHPEPNAASIAAAQAALDAVTHCADDALVLFLISGGASAMCELPLSGSAALEDVVLLNRLLIGSGASIAEVNCVRKHLSCVKGGRLAACAGTRDKITLLVSDVPDNALDALGSGPSLPDSSTVADCLEVLTRYCLPERLPTSIRRCIDDGLEESPNAEHLAFRDATTAVLLENSTFLEEAARTAIAMGYSVHVDCSCDDWDYEDAAKYLLSKLDSLRETGKKICLLSGGEVTVRLPEVHGVGGRNLQFCLYCAVEKLAPGTTVLGAGTDGIDGNSEAAGAVVDFTTRLRGEQIGLQIEAYLHGFDAYHYLAPLGYAIATGPTGNNLRDIRMLLWEEPASESVG
jgi:glycerate 2-kinase